MAARDVRTKLEPFKERLNLNSWLKLPLDEAIETLQKARAEIPEEWRGSAIIEMRASGGDYDSSPEIEVEVEWTRPETKAEMAWREAAEKERQRIKAADAEATERKYYERLKQKFEAGK